MYKFVMGCSRRQVVLISALLVLVGCHQGSTTKDTADAGVSIDAIEVDPEVCGDTIQSDLEECDDGNTTTGDGCSSDCQVEMAPAYADSYQGAPVAGPGIDDPTNMVNGIGGNLDVFSLGYDAATASVVLSWSGRKLVDTDGYDLIVFENGFQIGGTNDYFMDQIIVAVSHNGTDWITFEHDYVAPDETVYSSSPNHWSGFAGLTPTIFNDGSGPANPFLMAAGGDAFDLAAIADQPGGNDMLQSGIRYVRLTAAPSVINPDTGDFFVRDGISNGADIDGIYGHVLVAD